VAEIFDGVCKLAVAISVPDVFDVSPMRALCAVGCQRRGFREPKLVGDILLGIRWHVTRIVEKGAEKPYGTQLQRIPEAVRLPAPLSKERQVGIVQMEIPGELVG
jgi:hypothetical protein